MLLFAVVAGGLSFRTPATGADGTFEKVGEFRPFPAQNKLGTTALLSVVDDARRTWFFVTYTDPVTGATGAPNVWTFDLDGPKQRGNLLKLAAGDVSPIGVLDAESGTLLLVVGTSGSYRIAAIKSTADGPKVVAEWRPGLTTDSGVTGLAPKGLAISHGKGLLAADNAASKETTIIQFDVARLLAGKDPFDWRYRVRQCTGLPQLNLATAVGKSRRAPIVSLPCKAQSSNDLQGVVVVDFGTFTATSDDTDNFTEQLYPIAGDYRLADSYYDPGSDRISMRRVGPAQLVIFDARYRRWMRPVVFGQNNMEQSALDETTGRIYGDGDDPGAGQNREYLFVPEVRPTPPQNGLTTELITPSVGSTLVPKGRLAIDPPKRLVYVADVDPPPGSSTASGLFFHVYRDTRPPLDERRAFDPDKEVTNLSAEAQGYGARVSYVGGVGAGYSNAFSSNYPSQVAGVVAQGTRHISFARTLRARLTDGESAAEAIVSHPEGASDSELKNTSEQTSQGWPHESVGCRDFGDNAADAEDASGNAEVTCDLDYPRTTSAAVYQASTSDPRTAPVQRAATNAVISIHGTKGVTTTVTSEGSLDIPGIVGIGRVRATATTFAAGKKGTATSSYTREMRDVTIAGQPFCSSDCDPDAVAAAINTRFASLTASGTQVVATVPRPDPALLGSPGGVQAVVQRDLWDHEEDVGIHDGAEDRWEMPAFVVALYQDRRNPQHEIYSLAGVQAVSRLPTALADDIDELASPDPAVPSAGFSPDLPGGSPTALGDFDAPVGPPGSSLSAPLGPRSRAAGPGSLRFSERLAWTVASPFRSFPLLAVLAFLAVPVYLSSRRRLLLFHRPAQAGDTDAG